MATDFAVLLHRFLTSHLAGLRGCSPNTIASYRDTFKLLIAWFRDCRSIPPDKLTLDRIDADAITGSSTGWKRTAQQRLDPQPAPGRGQLVLPVAAIPGPDQDGRLPGHPRRPHQTQGPAERQSPHHRADSPSARPPDRSTRRGRRDATLLATLYDTAARVQELADLTVRDIRPQPPALAVLTGKGRKTRHVPLGNNTAALLNAYLTEHGLDKPGHDEHPLFTNQHRNKLSRGGIAWIIGKYQARAGDPALAGADLSPHVLRHSKAMHLYEAGVPLPYIRDILGHVDLTTTEIYAHASTEAKRKALEATYTEIVTDELPEWNHDTGLLTWLASL